MITEDMVIPVGKIKKPHGYKGELGIEVFFERNLFDDPLTPFFVKIDNILVPFFVDSIKGGAKGVAFIKFKDVDSDAEASVFSKKDIYALKTFLTETLGLSEEELEQEEDDLIGFQVRDVESGEVIGNVIDIFEGVEYDYLVIRKEGEEQTREIPLIDEFIDEIIEDSESTGEIRVSLPSGFLEI